MARFKALLNLPQELQFQILSSLSLKEKLGLAFISLSAAKLVAGSLTEVDTEDTHFIHFFSQLIRFSKSTIEEQSLNLLKGLLPHLFNVTDLQRIRIESESDLVYLDKCCPKLQRLLVFAECEPWYLKPKIQSRKKNGHKERGLNKRFTHLRCLHWNSLTPELSDLCHKMLMSSSNLVRLVLESVTLSAKWVKVLPKTIQYLKLSSAELDSDLPAKFGLVQLFVEPSSLKTLKLHVRYSNWLESPSLMDKKGFKFLEKLSIKNYFNYYSHRELISAVVGNCPRLNAISLTGVDMDERWYDVMPSSVVRVKLKCFQIEWTPITYVEPLYFMEDPTTLQELALCENVCKRVTDSNRELMISRSVDIPMTALEILLKQFKSLRKLRFGGVDTRSLQIIHGVYAENIKELSLARMNTEGLKWFLTKTFPCLKNLTICRLDWSQVLEELLFLIETVDDLESASVQKVYIDFSKEQVLDDSGFEHVFICHSLADSIQIQLVKSGSDVETKHLEKYVPSFLNSKMKDLFYTKGKYKEFFVSNGIKVASNYKMFLSQVKSVRA